MECHDLPEHPVPAARRGGNGVRHCHGTRRPAGGGPSHRQLHPFGSTGGNGHSGSENHSPGTPPGAPSSFTNAVGNFRISSTTDARDLSANEPITVKIRVTGTGNIHSIACPALTDASNWKLYPPNKLDPGQNTRSIQGTVEFQQMMRPVAQTDAIPPFELTFFDPSTQQYKTVTTAPFPWNGRPQPLLERRPEVPLPPRLPGRHHSGS
ncbi:hypothetical protein C1O62_09735 [Akkermansia muciniphila]|nr:hypothetical protein C1O62_09735 [Akkermansia muciniphila]